MSVLRWGHVSRGSVPENRSEIRAQARAVVASMVAERRSLHGDAQDERAGTRVVLDDIERPIDTYAGRQKARESGATRRARAPAATPDGLQQSSRKASTPGGRRGAELGASATDAAAVRAQTSAAPPSAAAPGGGGLHLPGWLSRTELASSAGAATRTPRQELAALTDAAAARKATGARSGKPEVLASTLAQAAASRSVGPPRPQSWLTRDELAAAASAASLRAAAAEEQAEGARMAAEMLRGELKTSESAQVAALDAALKAKARALETEAEAIQMRRTLDGQSLQLGAAAEEEAAAREATRKALQSTADLESKLVQSDARAQRELERADKAERLQGSARAALAHAKASHQADIDALRNELADAKQLAADHRSKAAIESSTFRSLSVQARESRALLASKCEEEKQGRKQVETAAAREAELYTERLSALRHVNHSLELTLRATLDSRHKAYSKATTLQEVRGASKPSKPLSPRLIRPLAPSSYGRRSRCYLTTTSQ